VGKDQEKYLAGTVPTGTWAGKGNNIVDVVNAGFSATWAFTAPVEGMVVWVDDTDVPLVYDGTEWIPMVGFGATSGLTAATTQTYAAAIQLPYGVSQTSVCANVNDGAKFPSAKAGRIVLHANDGVQTEKLYPFSGDNLGAGVDVAITIAAGLTGFWFAIDSTNWRKAL
jgi:hypothetical protein